MVIFNSWAFFSLLPASFPAITTFVFLLTLDEHVPPNDSIFAFASSLVKFSSEPVKTYVLFVNIVSSVFICFRYVMLGSVLDYISRTNLFNFVIFLSILIFLFKKIDVVGMLDNMKNAVIENIEASKTSKSDSETHLKEIEEKVSHIEEEIDGIIKKSEQNAKLVGEKIIEDANHTVESIKDNSKKLVENKSALLKNDILQRASEASIEVARNHIVNELNNNYDLHQRLIDESLEALNSYKG